MHKSKQVSLSNSELRFQKYISKGLEIRIQILSQRIFQLTPIRSLPYPNTDEVPTEPNTSPMLSYLVQPLLMDLAVIPSLGE